MEKEEEIFESNKLIALFMGYTEDEIQAEDWCGCNVLEECQFTGIKELISADYHSKWDWLMPVAIKLGIDYVPTDIEEAYETVIELIKCTPNNL